MQSAKMGGFSHGSGAWKSKFKVSAAVVPPEASLLGVQVHLLPVPSPGRPSVCVCVLISFSFRDTSHVGLWHTPMNLFYLNHLYKDPISKQLHSGVLGDTIQPTAQRGQWGRRDKSEGQKAKTYSRELRIVSQKLLWS